jgi:hypothetical protein
MTERGVPISTEVLAHIEPRFTPQDAMAREYLEFVTAPGNSSPVNPARPPGAGEIVAHLNYLAEAVAMGMYTAAEAAFLGELLKKFPYCANQKAICTTPQNF